MNKITVIGRLTKEPESRTTASGDNVATFSVAVNKIPKPKDGPDADFFNCSAWGKTASYVTDFLGKGRLVAVHGSMVSRNYTDQSGNSRTIWEIKAQDVQGLDRPRDEAAPRTAPMTDPSEGDQYDPFAD